MRGARLLSSALALTGALLACSSPERGDEGEATPAGTTGTSHAGHQQGKGGNGSAPPNQAGGTLSVGASGSGGQGASNAGSMLALKQPLERAGKMVLEFGDTYLEVTPEHGARITSLRRAGQELLTLTGAENFADAFGSTFWPSPQTWPWPPPAELDTMPYLTTASDGVITAVSEPNAATQLRVTKRFAADLARDAIDLSYEMTNTGAEPVSWAPWEITRMPPQGIAFWPTGGAPFGPQPLASESAGGLTWCDPRQTEGEGKLFADAGGGYLAYAVGRHMLVKQFADQPASAMAPGEAEIELYVNAGHDYVEVENQGAYAAIAPGASVLWRVRWYARALPPELSLAVGNTDLVAFVAKTLQ